MASTASNSGRGPGPGPRRRGGSNSAEISAAWSNSRHETGGFGVAGGNARGSHGLSRMDFSVGVDSGHGGSLSTNATVSTLTRTTWPTRRTMYSRVVVAVGVGADAAALVFAHLVLVDHPFQGAAVAEAVVEDLRRDAGKRERLVHLQRRSCPCSAASSRRSYESGTPGVSIQSTATARLLVVKMQPRPASCRPRRRPGSRGRRESAAARA